MLEKTESGWIASCEVCNWVGEPKPEQGQAQVEYLNHCKTKEHKTKKKETPPVPNEGEKKTPSIDELTPQEAILYYGEDEVINHYKRKKLKEFLETAPQVSAKQAEWIMMNYESDERAKVDPNSLYNLLIQSRLESQLAYRIVQNLVDLEQKLKQKVSGQQQYPPFPPMGMPSYLPLSPQFSIPWPQQQFQPFWHPFQQNPLAQYFPWMYMRDERYERLEREIKELKEEKKKIEIKETKVEDERVEKLEKELEKLREERDREEREKREREREEKWAKELSEIKEAISARDKKQLEFEKEEKLNKEITELKEAIKARSQSEVMTITVPLRDSNGNIITGPDGKPVQQMFQGPPSYIQALLAQQGSGATITPERLQVLIGSEIEKRLKSGGVSKEELERILEERETKRAWKDLESEMKELRKEIEKREKERIPIAGASEGTAIELKKLDLIGQKLDDMHDTIKTGLNLALVEREKPRERNIEDITKLDEELSILAKPVEEKEIKTDRVIRAKPNRES